jgi:hypothetical protein
LSEPSLPRATDAEILELAFVLGFVGGVIVLLISLLVAPFEEGVVGGSIAFLIIFITYVTAAAVLRSGGS